jgi:hypothetical protein
MAHLTEAACLIEQGAMFPRRQGFRDPAGSTVLMGFKPGACSIYFDDAPIYHFDLEGRWQRAFIEADLSSPDTPKNLAGVPGTHYLKSLDTSTVGLMRVREANEIKIQRRTLGYAETVDLDESIRTMAMTLHARIASGELQPVAPPSEGRTAGKAVDTADLLDFLERIADRDSSAWSGQKQQFMGTFGPLPMSPPGSPGLMVIQATMGDVSEPAIGFGGARTTPIHVRTDEEFKKHLQQVVSLWGRRLPQARGIYLAGSDLLHQPMPVVLNYLDQISEAISGSSIDILARVIDPVQRPQKSDISLMTHRLDGPAPTVEMLEEYRKRGVTHLTIGVESLNETVRRTYGRSWTNQDLVQWIQNAKEASLPLSMVLLIGAGGIDQPEDQAETISVLDELPWSEGTVIYLLDAAETVDGNPNEPSIAESNAAALHSMRAELATALKPRKVKVAHYTLEKDWQ